MGGGGVDSLYCGCLGRSILEREGGRSTRATAFRRRRWTAVVGSVLGCGFGDVVLGINGCHDDTDSLMLLSPCPPDGTVIAQRHLDKIRTKHGKEKYQKSAHFNISQGSVLCGMEDIDFYYFVYILQYYLN